MRIHGRFEFKVRLSSERARIGICSIWPPFALMLTLLLQACVNIGGEMEVTGRGLGKPGPFKTILAGKHPIQLSIAKNSKNASELAFKDLNAKFRFHLPAPEVLKTITEPLTLDSAELGQNNISLTISRTASGSRDEFGITFSTDVGASGQPELLASAIFKYGENTPTRNNGASENFLQSFQKVRTSQRGAVVSIDAAVSPPAYNSVLNHSVTLLLAPWLHARYSRIQWIINTREVPDAEKFAKWADVVDAYPVIDYFAFEHTAKEYIPGPADLNWKKNQLRFLYTEACQSADYLWKYLGLDGAGIAIGNRGPISASPFFAIPLIHTWTYGGSTLQAARVGWGLGTVLASIANFLSFDRLVHSHWTNPAEMLRQSELVLGWTSELLPEQLTIDSSSSWRRDTPENQRPRLSAISKYRSHASQ